MLIRTKEKLNSAEINGRKQVRLIILLSGEKCMIRVEGLVKKGLI